MNVHDIQHDIIIVVMLLSYYFITQLIANTKTDSHVHNASLGNIQQFYILSRRGENIEL